MKKRILSLVLALVFVLSCAALAACDGGNTLPPSGDGTKAPSGDTEKKPDDTKDDGTSKPADDGEGTNANGLPLELYDNYVRDSKELYYGKMGIGGKGVSYDKMLVKVGSKTAYDNKFDESADIPETLFSTYGGAVADWKVSDDTITEGNKKLSYTGKDDSILTLGNPEWGKGRFTTAIALEEGGQAEIYFCVKDENNYYKLTVTTDAKTGVYVDKFENGKSTNIGKLAIGEPVGSWFNTSIEIVDNGVNVYVAGVEMFHISEEKTAHTYSGLLGIGQWNTEFYVDDIVVTDVDGKVLYKQDFEDGKFLETAKFGVRHSGSWSIANTSDWEIIEVDGNHVLHYKNSGVYGSVVLFDAGLPADCTGYTFTYRGYKVAGSEGYPCVWDWNESTMDKTTGAGNDYMCFNLGGWSGQAGIQIISGGGKENRQNNADVGLLTGEWQEVKLVMTSEATFAFFHDDFVQVHWYE